MSGIGEVLVSARSYDQYAAMFDLTDADLDALRDDLASRGVVTDVRPVPYELQRGGDRMMVLGADGPGASATPVGSTGGTARP